MPVADGDTVKLGGRSWHARHTPRGLELSTTTSTSDRQQLIRQRVADFKHEVQQRQQEKEALHVQRAQLMTSMEEV